MQNSRLNAKKLWAISGVSAMIAKEPDVISETDMSCSWSKPSPFGEDEWYVWISLKTKNQIVVEIHRDMVGDFDGDDSLALAYLVAGYCSFENIKVVWK